MQVICLEEPAFFALIEQVLNRLRGFTEGHKEKWINEEEAKALLNIRAKSTMQTLRNEGKIRFTQPQRKIILYDRGSIMEYLETHAKDTF